MGPAWQHMWKPVEKKAVSTYINSQHIIFKGLTQLLHNLYFGTGTGLNCALHSDGSFRVVYAQILQAGHQEKEKNFLFSKGKIKSQKGHTQVLVEEAGRRWIPSPHTVAQNIGHLISNLCSDLDDISREGLTGNYLCICFDSAEDNFMIILQLHSHFKEKQMNELDISKCSHSPLLGTVNWNKWLTMRLLSWSLSHVQSSSNFCLLFQSVFQPSHCGPRSSEESLQLYKRQATIWHLSWTQWLT